jgi:hypothetical protein
VIEQCDSAAGSDIIQTSAAPEYYLANLLRLVLIDGRSKIGLIKVSEKSYSNAHIILLEAARLENLESHEYAYICGMTHQVISIIVTTSRRTSSKSHFSVLRLLVLHHAVNVRTS